MGGCDVFCTGILIFNLYCNNLTPPAPSESLAFSKQMNANGHPAEESKQLLLTSKAFLQRMQDVSTHHPSADGRTAPIHGISASRGNRIPWMTAYARGGGGVGLDEAEKVGVGGKSSGNRAERTECSVAARPSSVKGATGSCTTGAPPSKWKRMGRLR